MTTHLFDFDTVVNRKGTHSYKWDTLEPATDPELIPMWVADMDFPSPPAAVAAIKKRTEHGVFGYTVRTDSYVSAVLEWIHGRHGWNIPKEWMAFCPPGVVQAARILVELLTRPGERVILHQPGYLPLADVITGTGRVLAKSPLIYDSGEYRMDLKNLEHHLQQGARLLLMCNPHNPTGRVWRRAELEAVARLCLAHGAKVISDDIHADIVYSGHTYTPLASISQEMGQSAVTLISISKSFNLGGLQTSTAVIPSEALRKRFNRELEIAQTRLDTVFGAVALEACYRHAGPWLDALTAYLEENLRVVTRFVADYLPGITLVRPEGTFLCWLDCRNLGLSHAETHRFFTQKAKVVFTDGEEFGEMGRGFQRMNIACPRRVLERALNQMKSAVDRYLVSIQKG